MNDSHELNPQGDTVDLSGYWDNYVPKWGFYNKSKVTAKGKPTKRKQGEDNKVQSAIITQTNLEGKIEYIHRVEINVNSNIWGNVSHNRDGGKEEPSQLPLLA